MGARQSPAVEQRRGAGRRTGRSTGRAAGRGSGRLRLVPPPGAFAEAPDEEAPDGEAGVEAAVVADGGGGATPALRARPGDEAGTTTAEYTVVTGAAVAFGALLFKLLTSDWGERILSTAFRHVISLLGA